LTIEELHHHIRVVGLVGNSIGRKDQGTVFGPRARVPACFARPI